MLFARRGLASGGRVVAAALACGCSASLSATVLAEEDRAQGSDTVAPPPEAAGLTKPPTTQWLWTIGSTQLRRDDSGATIYVDSASGESLSARPAAVPPEAYERPWRRQHPWEPTEASSLAKGSRGRVAKHLLLIRHGQYDTNGKHDDSRTLTPMGEQQAIALAQRLRLIDAATEGYYKHFKLNQILTSKLARAVQTADSIVDALPDVSVRRDADLNEGRPCLPEPPPSHASRYTNRHYDGERIEGAYRMLCAKPPPEQEADSYHVVVCHANVIRYIVCRALQLPPEAWLRFSLPHTSLTHLVIRASGDVSLRSLGDAGHLEPGMVSYS
jgi:broad specificity phosphatase PhoE